MTNELPPRGTTRFLQCIGVLLGQRGCRKSCISALRPTDNLAMHVEPDANFDNQRRLIAYAPILQPVCVVRDPHGSVFFASPNGTVRSFLPTPMIVTKRVA